jgi:hypothetical protein
MGGIDSDFIGGLCGYNDGLIAECYSATFVETDSFAYYVSGFCGRDSASGVVTACFWDVENSGMVASAGATGKTTAEMEAQSTFVAMNWDFANIWYMEVYPALRCFNSPGTYSYWLMNNPGIPAALRAVSDIPVSDGVPNLIKYACGLPAMDACTTADLMSIERGSSNTFSVLYYKSKTAGDVILQPVWAETLYGPWSALDIATELVGEDAQREQWKASIPVGNSGFIRLRAIQ